MNKVYQELEFKVANSTLEQTTDDVNSNPCSSSGENHNHNNDGWQIVYICLKRSSKSGFGFSITGGSEYSIPIRVSYIAKNGFADRDGRLKLDDIILGANKISFVNIRHGDALRVLKSTGKYITMRIKRLIPQITVDNPSYQPKEAKRRLIVGNVMGSVPDTCIGTFINSTTDAQDDKLRPLGDLVSNVENKPTITESKIRNRTRVQRKPLHEYDVGALKDLTDRYFDRDYIEIHHLIQKDIAMAIFPEYKEAEAVCIVLSRSKRHSAPEISKDDVNLLLSHKNSKEILTRTIKRHTELNVIPSPVLLEAILLHCAQFPRIYETPNYQSVSTDINVIDYSVYDIIRRIPSKDLRYIGDVQDIIKYGNCVKDIPSHVRQFILEKNQPVEPNSKRLQDYRGVYVAHRYIDLLSGLQLVLTLRIELDHTTKRQEESCNCVTTITTDHYAIYIMITCSKE
ncbi:unnamed protein product [Rotaria magnacalcarata]|uniref:PDZ domain-containing protein n=1 Tax=Rotaria magnacalcarata TaxID=392030 RepID=A0A816P777_9BILA|nr:unnamed protein product [Rotaria magnacalcarata]